MAHQLPSKPSPTPLSLTLSSRPNPATQARPGPPFPPAQPPARALSSPAPSLARPAARGPLSSAPRPLALTPSPTSRARMAEPPSTSRNNRAIYSVIPGEPPICGMPPQHHRAALQIAPHASETPSHPASAATQTLAAVSALPGLAAPLLRRGPAAPLRREPPQAPRWHRHGSRELPVHFCLPIRRE